MNAVGIDVSKGKSMVAAIRPFGEVVLSPFEVSHTGSELGELARTLKSLPGETRVVMEYTGYYHAPVAQILCEAGIYVSVVNPLLVHDYGNNSLRKVKTDKKDAFKLASYALEHWLSLPQYYLVGDTRLMLKTAHRQYEQMVNMRTIQKNNLISLLDSVFPNANRLFSSPPRDDGSEKWVDFVSRFWHCECVSDLSENKFTECYETWCHGHGYNFSKEKASSIYAYASDAIGVMPKCDATKFIVKQTVSQLQASCFAIAAMKKKMLELASTLPEYPIVMAIYGVGEVLGPQLMAEIGDVRRFYSKEALVAYAGLDSPPDQPGQKDGKGKAITKRGSPSLRRTIFLVMSIILQNAPEGEDVYRYMLKKRSEGKPYKVYMIASANKFLRRYYAIVKRYLNDLEGI